MTTPGPRLGIDFGTSHTVAAFSRPDGRTEALLFDSSPLLPSAVYLTEDGELRTGRDAERNSDLPYVAISTRCAHLGCPVRYIQASQRFVCPCHGGVYDFEGKVEGGPPVRPLDRFYTRVRNGRVQVGDRFSVNSELERFPHPRDPSEHLDGLWQYLYPARPST